MSKHIDHYDATYGRFGDRISHEVRREAFGEDIGQNSWLTVDEFVHFFKLLDLKPTSHVLDVACGSGGPALFLTRKLGCHVVGVDNNEKGIDVAIKMMKERGLESLVRFLLADASKSLPFKDETFDAIVCVDAINHLPGRLQVLTEWRRILKSEGLLFFTDPIIVTGLISNEEIAIRSSIGHSLFAPLGEDERLIKLAELQLLRREDVTNNMALVSKRRFEARLKRRVSLIEWRAKLTLMLDSSSSLWFILWRVKEDCQG